MAVNCASIPETLIEAELFGYEDGAFTGARRKGAVGRIVQANGGTLFLDEIGDMPLPLQARLLRVLQERCVTPLGSLKSIPVDIAVIGATHRNLRDMIDAGHVPRRPVLPPERPGRAAARAARPQRPATWSRGASCWPNARMPRRRISAAGDGAVRGATPGPATSASSPTCCAPRP